MPLAPGSVFAGFTITAKLGSGGMGEVYLVDHPRLPRREALKILPPSLTSDNEYRQRFVREADLAAEMWHPHIVAVHDRGEADGQLWITMDYVEGTDAAALVGSAHRAGLPPQFAVEIVAAVADALDYAHSRGLLHRDVKPANILCGEPDPSTRKRRILLSDFGIARKIDDASGLTATNMTVGSIAYSAPEQLMGATLSGAADQYALAATAFQLLSGRKPFDNSNAATVISNHLSAPPPLLAEQRPDLAAYDAVIAKGMAKQPADRYESCSAFADALASALAATPNVDHSTRIAVPAAKTAPAPGPAAPATVAPSPVAPRESPRAETPANAAPAASKGRRVGIAAAAAVVVAAAVGGGAFFFLRDSDSAVPSTGASTSSTAAAGVSVDPSLVPASAIDALLLPVNEVDSMTRQQLDEVSTSNELLDASSYFERPECSPAIYPAEYAAYGSSGVEAVRQSVLQTPESSRYFYIVDQSVVALSSAESAAQLLADSRQAWQDCAGSAMSVTTATGTFQATLADVVDRPDGIVQDRAVDDGVSPRYGCQHTLAVQRNVVAEAVVCADVETGNRSQAIVDAILSNIPA